jgi:ribosomal protein L36
VRGCLQYVPIDVQQAGRLPSAHSTPGLLQARAVCAGSGAKGHARLALVAGEATVLRESACPRSCGYWVFSWLVSSWYKTSRQGQRYLFSRDGAMPMQFFRVESSQVLYAKKYCRKNNVVRRMPKRNHGRGVQDRAEWGVQLATSQHASPAAVLGWLL